MFKKKQKKANKQAAFTFVEVLVAIMLSAFVMTAFGSMMALSMRVAEANEMEQLAQLKAQQVIEFFRRERLIRGWSTFFSNLTNDQVYCLNTFPAEGVTALTVGHCSDTPKTDLNFFYYKVEAEIAKADTANEESVLVLVNIYRYTAGGTLIDSDPFFSVEQTFKQY